MNSPSVVSRHKTPLASWDRSLAFKAKARSCWGKDPNLALLQSIGLSLLGERARMLRNKISFLSSECTTVFSGIRT